MSNSRSSIQTDGLWSERTQSWKVVSSYLLFGNRLQSQNIKFYSQPNFHEKRKLDTDRQTEREVRRCSRGD